MILSCHIGGNIARTPAAATPVKCSVTMRYVLGLEGGAADGEILTLGGRKLMKMSPELQPERVVGSEARSACMRRNHPPPQPLMKNAAPRCWPFFAI